MDITIAGPVLLGCSRNHQRRWAKEVWAEEKSGLSQKRRLGAAGGGEGCIFFCQVTITHRFFFAIFLCTGRLTGHGALMKILEVRRKRKDGVV